MAPRVVDVAFQKDGEVVLVFSEEGLRDLLEEAVDKSVVAAARSTARYYACQERKKTPGRMFAETCLISVGAVFTASICGLAMVGAILNLVVAWYFI
jgi:hypothetical protein